MDLNVASSWNPFKFESPSKRAVGSYMRLVRTRWDPAGSGTVVGAGIFAVRQFQRPKGLSTNLKLALSRLFRFKLPVDIDGYRRWRCRCCFRWRNLPV